MSGLEINTKKLGEIYKEWRGNESCYDNGRPVFEADELLDFAQFCLKHEANVLPTGEGQSNIPDVSSSVCKCPYCATEMKGIELTHYRCKNCNLYFTN